MTFNSITRIFFIFLTVSVLQCGKSVRTVNSDILTLYETSSKKMQTTVKKIDRGKTRTLYFRLSAPTGCIRVSILASYLPYKFAKGKKYTPVYFAVERMIDVSSFGKAERTLYTVLGKNYDAEWNKSGELTVCSSAGDPLMKLDASSVYRIRLTTFREDTVTYLIKIYGDRAVKFYHEEKEARIKNPR